MKETLPISTTYSVTNSHQFVFNSTSPLTEADVQAIEADPNLAFRMFHDGEVLPSGFSNSDVGDFFGGQEGVASGAYIQNLSVPLGADTFSTSTSGVNTVTTTITDGFNQLKAGTGINAINNRIIFDNSVSYTPLYPLMLEFTAIVNSGSLVWTRIETSDNNYVPLPIGDHAVIDGLNRLIVYVNSLNDTKIELTHTNANTFDIDMTDIFVRKITAVEILNYTPDVRTNLLNATKGTSNLKLIQDGSGRSTGTAPVGTLSHSSDGHLDTQWKPNLAKYTIQEVVQGNLADLDAAGVSLGTFSYRIETRKLTHEEGVGDHYYIGGTEQAYVPDLPNELITAKLGQIALIGYPDKIDFHKADFKVGSIVIPPLENGVYVDGEILVDNGVPVIDTP